MLHLFAARRLVVPFYCTFFALVTIGARSSCTFAPCSSFIQNDKPDAIGSAVADIHELSVP